jgi:hypothetical protein
MPINLTTQTWYEISIDKLMSYIDSAVHIYNDKLLQKVYFEEWGRLLSRDDKILRNEFDSGLFTKLYNIGVEKEPEMFQFPIILEDQTILLHFRVSYMNKLIDMSGHAGEKTSIDDFVSKTSFIKWSPPEETAKYFLDLERPVITVPMPYGQYHLLVIDGNHRIAMKQNIGSKEIAVWNFALKTVKDNKLLSSGFELNFYLFYNEVVSLGNLKINEELPDHILMQKSWLYS